MAKSTVERGNDFRNLVASMLEAAGFVAETETREAHKKVDVRWRREDIDGTALYFVEAKDYSDTLPRNECQEFVTDYGTLIDSGAANRAWLISRGDVSPDGRALVDAKRDLKCMTFAEFQRRLMGIDGYLHSLIAEFQEAGIANWYIPLHTKDCTDLEESVRAWIDEADALPIAIVAGYGKGKSTFAQHLTAALAQEALNDQSRRVPILVRLGEIVDEQSLEGLLGKVFTSRPGVRGYNFGLFEKLNRAGRFVVLFDGFDEMKHGMTLAHFEANIKELMRLDLGAAKVIILGRHTAFQDDDEFRAIIHGRQRTTGGQEVVAQGRRAFREISVRDFSLEEARSFVDRFFPISAHEAARGSDRSVDIGWITARRTELLAGDFDSLLARPVHAQMLCQVATDPEVSLVDLSTYGLFDRFVHFLIDREVSKRGRDHRFSLPARRRFNAGLALWLWEKGRVSTVTLTSIPMELCRQASAGVHHDYDEVALRRELTAGCLIEKSGDTIFFGHRSLQEFLIAEILIQTDLTARWRGANVDLPRVLKLLNHEIIAFIVDAAATTKWRGSISGWLSSLARLSDTKLPRLGMKLFIDLTKLNVISVPPTNAAPWYAWLSYFVSNDSVDFAPRSAKAAAHLLELLKLGLQAPSEIQAAVLLLVAQAMARHSNARTHLTTEVMAIWLDPRSILNSVRTANKLGKSDHHYVSQNEDLPFWTFLQVARFECDDGVQKIIVDMHRVVDWLTQIIRIGFDNKSDDPTQDIFPIVSVPVHTIYNSWHMRDKELKEIRPFFDDESLRAKIMPLEIGGTSSR